MGTKKNKEIMAPVTGAFDMDWDESPSESSLEKANGGCTQLCPFCGGSGDREGKPCYSCGGTGWRR